MDKEQLLLVGDAIRANPHLFSARCNRDYLTIGIEIAEQFPDLAEVCHMQNINGDKFHATMVPIAVVREAMGA
jgi:hypothetical protein